MGLWPSVAPKAAFSLAGTVSATWTAPHSVAVQVLNVLFTWTTTATVGNRSVVVKGSDAAGNVLWYSTSNVALTASQAGTFSYQAAVSESISLGTIWTLSLPPFAVIPPGGSISVYDVNAIDAADTLGVLTMTFFSLV